MQECCLLKKKKMLKEKNLLDLKLKHGLWKMGAVPGPFWSTPAGAQLAAAFCVTDCSLGKGGCCRNRQVCRRDSCCNKAAGWSLFGLCTCPVTVMFMYRA